MGVKLLPPRLYRSELASRESLRDTLLLVELDTARKRVENQLRRENTEKERSVNPHVA